VSPNEERPYPAALQQSEYLFYQPRPLSRSAEQPSEQIATTTVKIKHYDRLIQQLTETESPETQALIKVYTVGQLTALAYVLTLDSKERIERNRDVRCYLGLRPR
jgi:transposase